MLILLPVDESDVALDAVRHALRLRDEGLALSVVLANAQDAPHLYEVVWAPDPEVLEQVSEGAGQHALKPAQALLDKAGVPYVSEVGHGDPARVLVDIAERHGCDAIIMASGHAGLLTTGRLGPVALAVLHHASMPVTIVRHAEPERPDDQ